MPTRRNSAPVEMPWLIICSTPPVIALRGEGERAEHDEAEVGDRRVGDEPLQVRLHRGDDRAVDDADHAEREQQRREVRRRPRGTGRAEAQEPVGAELQHARRPGSTEPAVGASVWASGSQVWNGNSGTFTANAMAKARNSHRAVVGGDAWRARRCSTRSKRDRPPFAAGAGTPVATMPTSMNAEPTS